MATIEKRQYGKVIRWRARVRVKGFPPKTSTFSTKAAAQRWAQEMEREYEQMRATGTRPSPVRDSFLVADLFRKYAEEVSPGKRGARWERVRLEKIGRSALGRKRVVDIQASDIALWRDESVKSIAASSVNRELTLLKAVFRRATEEWGWFSESPAEKVRRLPEAGERIRRISSAEEEAIVVSSGYTEGVPPLTKMELVGACFVFALETGMRSGEILALVPADVNLDRRFVAVRRETTKTNRARVVPLSKKAAQVIRDVMAAQNQLGTKTLFGLSGSARDALFRKIRDRAGICDLHFHDTRREALSRLSRIYTVLELARISGHLDVRTLAKVYYQPDPDELVSKLVDLEGKGE